MQVKVCDMGGMDGPTLRKLRESAGLTQTELAAKLAVAPATVSNAEANKRNVSVPLALAWIHECNATMITVPLLGDREKVLLIELAALLPSLHPVQLGDLAALVTHWRQENVNHK